MPNVNLRGADPRNYLVPGRVAVWFRREGLTAESDWQDLGHVLEPVITQDVERLDHFSNRRSERVKDRSIVTERQMRLSFRGDELNMDNVRLALGGSAAAVDGTTTVRDAKILKNPGNGLTIDLGVTNLAAVVVRSEGLETPVTYVSPTDYTVVLATGIITIAAGALANAGTVPRIHVHYSKSVNTQKFQVHDGEEIKGEAVFQVLGKGGERYQLAAKNVLVTVNGDINFGEGSSWQEFPLSMEILADEDGLMPTFHRLKEDQTF